MSTTRICCAALFLATVTMAPPAMAAGANLYGRLDYLGTESELVEGGYQARIRIRLVNSVCSTDPAPKMRWIVINSGRMDGQYAHNLANIQNVMQVLLKAFDSAYEIELLNVSSCDDSKPLTVNAWSSFIGVRKP
jgi:hypothetical protein